jgi:hypothetical protein
MSVEYYLCCDKCKHTVWSGCAGLSGFQFPYKNEHSMKEIGDFLRNHFLCDAISYKSEHYVEDYFVPSSS